MAKRRRVRQVDWDRYEKNINDFIDVDSGKQTFHWLRKINTPYLYGEDKGTQYLPIQLEGLFQYNYIRTWPANVNTPSGELEGENQVLYISVRYLKELGYVDEFGYWIFNWSEDRFVVNGKGYKPDGDTQVSQANNKPLLMFVILQREDPEESNRLRKIVENYIDSFKLRDSNRAIIHDLNGDIIYTAVK